MFRCWKSSGRFFNTRHCPCPVRDFFSCWLWTCSPSSRPSWKVSRRYFSSVPPPPPPDHPLPLSPVDFPPRSTNFLLFPAQPAENRDGEFWNSRLLSRNYSCIHGEGRLQVWIMRYVTDGIDTFADSRFEFRWIFARVKCVKFRACIYVYTVESSRRCSGIFNFFSRILFREFPLFFIYNLSKNYFS